LHENLSLTGSTANEPFVSFVLCHAKGEDLDPSRVRARALEAVLDLSSVDFYVNRDYLDDDII